MKFSSYIRKFRVEQLQSHIWDKGFLIYEEILKYFPIYEEPLITTLQLLHSEFPYIRGKFDFLFYQCTYSACKLKLQRYWETSGQSQRKLFWYARNFSIYTLKMKILCLFRNAFVKKNHFCPSVSFLLPLSNAQQFFQLQNLRELT